MTSGRYEEGMSYVEKLDFREQEHRHALERQAQKEINDLKIERQRTRRARKDVWITFFVGLFVVTLLLGICFAIYKGTRPGPYSGKPDKDERRETACMAAGGTWLPGSLVVGEDGLCVLPGKVPTP